MSEYKQFIYVGLTLIAFIFMFRYDISDPAAEGGAYRLDRWTGEVERCAARCD